MKLLHLHLAKGSHSNRSDCLVVGPLLCGLIEHSFTLVDSFGLGVDEVGLTFELYFCELGFNLTIGA